MGERASRPLRSFFSFAGYASLFFLLPQHYLLHRIWPSDPNPPILAVSPAELDYEYVKFGLQQWPVINWTMYVGLTLCVVWHAAEGSRIIWNTWMAEKTSIWKKNAKKHAITVFAVVLPVVTGLLAMAREPLMVFSSTAQRYEAAFRQHFLFRV
jgi:succinate dehydrogenase/fumarate reductase cytochrome b subunit